MAKLKTKDPTPKKKKQTGKEYYQDYWDNVHGYVTRNGYEALKKYQPKAAEWYDKNFDVYMKSSTTIPVEVKGKAYLSPLEYEKAYVNSEKFANRIREGAKGIPKDRVERHIQAARERVNSVETKVKDSNYSVIYGERASYNPVNNRVSLLKGGYENLYPNSEDVTKYESNLFGSGDLYNDRRSRTANTEIHEYHHAATVPLAPGQASIIKKGRRPITDIRSNDPMTGEKSKLELKEIIDRIEHNSPIEQAPEIQQMRYNMYRQGIYNDLEDDRPITKDHLNKLRETPKYIEENLNTEYMYMDKELNLGTDKLIEKLNKVADNTTIKKKGNQYYGADGGILPNELGALLPMLNLAVPGLGTVASGVNNAAGMMSPSTYKPVKENTNPYGLSNGGPTDPPIGKRYTAPAQNSIDPDLLKFSSTNIVTPDDLKRVHGIMTNLAGYDVATNVSADQYKQQMSQLSDTDLRMINPYLKKKMSYKDIASTLATGFAKGGVLPQGQDQMVGNSAFQVKYPGDSTDAKNYGSVNLDKDEIVSLQDQFVFSEDMKIPNSKKSFADVAKKIIKKIDENKKQPYDITTEHTNKLLQKEKMDLMKLQESLKAAQSPSTTNMADGGPLSAHGYSYPDYYVDSSGNQFAIKGASDKETKQNIKDYQQMLKAKGVYDGRIDGIWGRKTERGNRLYQGPVDPITPGTQLERGEYAGLVESQNQGPREIPQSITDNIVGNATQDLTNKSGKKNPFAAGDWLQLAEIASKFSMLGQPTRVSPNTINVPQVDSAPYLRQSSESFNAATESLNNFRPSSRNAMLSNLYASKLRNDANTLANISTTNKQLQFQTDQFNTRQKDQARQMNLQSEAALDQARQAAFTTVGNTGRALNQRKASQRAEELMAAGYGKMYDFLMNDITKMREQIANKK